MTGNCPNCGHNPNGDKIVERDGFKIDPLGALEYQGDPVPFAHPGMIAILHLLASNHGRRMTVDAIGQQCSDEEHISNTVTVRICRMRKAFKQGRLPFPVRSQRSKPGYWWGVEA